jgi:hypothetical protein
VQWRPGEIHDEPYTFAGEDSANAMGTTRAQAVSENFGIKLNPTQYASGAQLSLLDTGITKPNSLDYAGISPDLFKYAINVAYNPPFISGDISISTASTVTTQGNLTHGVVDSELNDFTGTVSLTALGGFKLEGAPQTQASAITTTVATTGLIRTGFTIGMSAAFTMPNIASSFVNISGVAVSFPTATVTVSAAVAMTTGADSNTAFTVSPTGLIGMIRTNHESALPITATVPALTDILIVKAPAASQIFTTDTQTRTHVIPADDRNTTIPQQTRIVKAEGM